MNDLGLAAWFGGTLSNAIALNGAAAQASDPAERLRVADAGWARWAPVNLASIGVHLVGAIGIGYANKSRVATQKGVLASTVAKSVLTAAALGVTAYSRVLGKKVEQAEGRPTRGVTEPASDAPDDAAASAQRQLALLQWTIPALTGALGVLNAVHGEQQRPVQQLVGRLARPAKALGLAA
ncbi:hypothetical protein [Pseudonocardia ailaonensis]